MLKDALKQQIKLAFVSLENSTATTPDAAYDLISQKIADAVDLYVKAQLVQLQTALELPGAFVGTGTGVVTITPGTFTAYDPNPL